MKYRYLGKSGLAVSTICLGTATFGQKDWGCNETEAIKILDFYVNKGGNFIDTADQYGQGSSESIIGKWLSNRNRDNLVIASKCFFPTDNNINSRGLSKKHIIAACSASLMRLKTDYIDLYQLHNQDPHTPLEEILEALDFLIKQGKIRYTGLSNFPGWKITKLNFMSSLRNYQGFTSGQFLYNLLKRDIEREILPACEDMGIGVLCWSPLSGGMLTGKYFNQDEPPLNSRLDKRKDVVKDRFRIWVDKSYDIVQKVIEIAKKYNVSPSVVALSWLLRNRNISSVIIGARSLEHIIDNLAASEWEIPEKDFSELDIISKIELGYPNDIFINTTQNWFSNIK